VPQPNYMRFHDQYSQEEMSLERKDIDINPYTVVPKKQPNTTIKNNPRKEQQRYEEQDYPVSHMTAPQQRRNSFKRYNRPITVGRQAEREINVHVKQPNPRGAALKPRSQNNNSNRVQTEITPQKYGASNYRRQ